MQATPEKTEEKGEEGAVISMEMSTEQSSGYIVGADSPPAAPYQRSAGPLSYQCTCRARAASS